MVSIAFNSRGWTFNLLEVRAMPLSGGLHSTQLTVGLVILYQLPLLFLFTHSTESPCLLPCYSDTGPFIPLHDLC